MYYLRVRDTVVAEDSIGMVLGQAYREMFFLIGQRKLRPGRMMGFYYSSAPPFVLDAAIEVDRVPKMEPGRIRIDSIKGGDAVIVHYKGPYGQVALAYAALNGRMRELHVVGDGPPFEIYLNSPATVSDPYELRTDVCQLVRPAGK